MKTRDELAEMFAVAALQTFGRDESAEWEPIVKDGFNLADAFVAERERRAVHPGDATKDTPFDGSRCGIDQCCANLPTHRDRNDRTAWLSGPCCGSPECCTLGGSEGDGWSRAPLTGIDAISAGVRAVAAEFDRVVAAVPPRDPLAQTGFCIGGHHGECPGNGVGAFAGPCGCDCHDATPAPVGLKFTASGALLSADGHRYATREHEGYSADASKLGEEFSAVVRIAARDRDHAERIVAAMLPVGRGTK